MERIGLRCFKGRTDGEFVTLLSRLRNEKGQRLNASLYILGSSTWARTRDTRINSPLLYRLSYRGIGRTCEGVIILAKRFLVNHYEV